MKRPIFPPVVLGREGKLDAVAPGKDVWDFDSRPGGVIGGGPVCDPFPGGPVSVKTSGG